MAAFAPSDFTSDRIGRSSFGRSSESRPVFSSPLSSGLNPGVSWALFLLGAAFLGAGLLAHKPAAAAAGFTLLLLHQLLCFQAQTRGAARMKGLSREAEGVRSQLAALESDLADYTTRLTGIERSLPGLMFEAHVNPAGEVSFPFFAGSLLAMLGYSAEEARRDPTLVFSKVHPRDRERRDRLIRMSLVAKASYADVCRLVAPNGTVLWIRCRWSFDRETASGSVWTVLWTDITEQYEERQLAEAANLGKTEAVARISHDLRTPLNAIIGFTDLLLAEGLSAKERKYATASGQAAQALLWLVNQLLTFQKAESRTQEANQVSYRLDQLIAQSLSLLEPIAERKDLKIETWIGPDVPAALTGDPERIKQVLVNFLSNAVKFSEDGVIELWVSRLDHVDGEVALRFAVKDRGIGIPADKLAKLFSPYVQANASTGWMFGGSGLGLAICRQVAESLGGRVGATSEPGSGSVFWLEVQQGICHLGLKADLAAEAPSRGPAASVLIADDVTVNRELVAAILEDAGHEICLVQDGNEALRAAQERHFDLILMDIRMPGMDGLEAARAIRTRPGPNRHSPIVALTAGANDTDVARSKSAGMDGHLSKPVAAADLLRTVSEWTNPEDDRAPPTIDENWLAGLAERVGSAKVAEYLTRFVEEADGLIDDCTGEDRARTGKLAHQLVGSAGQLGFRALSGASRDLMLACHDRPAAVLSAAAATQRNLRRAIDAGRHVIAQLSAEREGLTVTRPADTLVN